MIRAVFDANVYVSALLRPQGPPGSLLRRWLTARSFTLVVTLPIAEEVRTVLNRPKIRQRIHLTPAEVDAWLNAILIQADVVHADTRLKIVAADPGDDKYLEAADAGRAGVIVTGDRHLLDLPPRPESAIITPAAFLKMLEAAEK